MKRITLSVFRTDNVLWVDFGPRRPVKNKWHPAPRGRRRSKKWRQFVRLVPMMAGLALAGCENFAIANDLSAPGPGGDEEFLLAAL